MEIESLEQFIYQIKEIDQCEEGYVRFYRGQPVDKPLIPNAFREQCFIDNESEMYNEIFNKKPEEFANSKCTFDYLVKMQHYKIPTRLLDITSNPLIALFFACSQNPVEPTVYCLDIPIGRVKNYSSDSVTILASLARYDKYSKEELLNDVLILNSIRNAFVDGVMDTDLKDLEDFSMLTSSVDNCDIKSFSLFEKVKSNILRDALFYPYPSNINHGLTDNEIELIIKEILIYLDVTPKWSWREESSLKSYIKKAIDKDLSHIENLRLLHEVKQDKPYFLDLMHIDTFNTIYCVKPRLDNPRIIKQKGSFLLFPHAKAILEKAVKITKISIDKLRISSIIDDLSIVDVNEESLFDDIDTVSLSIREKYRKHNKLK